MASEIASRIKAKLLKRRYSSNAPSLISNLSAASSAEGDNHVPHGHGETPASNHREQSALSTMSRARHSGSDGRSGVLVVAPVAKSENADSDCDEEDDEEDDNGSVGVSDNAGQEAKSPGGPCTSHSNSHRNSHTSRSTKSTNSQGHEQCPTATNNSGDTPQLQRQASSDLQPATTATQSPSPSPPPSSPPPPPPQSSSPPPSSSSSTAVPSQQPHPSLRPPQPSSRLHSIDEGPCRPLSPTAAALLTSDDNNLRGGPLDGDGDAISPLTRDRRPAPLELGLTPNHHRQTDASAFSQLPSIANTPAAAVAPCYFTLQPPTRRQSLISHRQSNLINSLLHGPPTYDDEDAPTCDLDTDMVTNRKIWVKRPHASPTLITINEDDLVDDVRDMILRKYTNSLGRTFDSPDLTLRICPRDQSQKERFLGPEEHMARTVDAYFPGGQNVDEALVIDIPRRTPRASPRPTAVYVTEDGRPPEAGDGYFPPVGGVPSPHHHASLPAPTNSAVPHSIGVLNTGHIPPIPSPGGTRRAYPRPDRPRVTRHTSSSPNVVANGTHANAVPPDSGPHGMQHYIQRPSHSRAHSNSSDHKGISQPPAPPMPTSPVVQSSKTNVATPPARVSSPRPPNRTKKTKKPSEYQSMQGILSGGVPPISVLIVEDNPINLKLLEAFVKRLKVRWQTAMNGRDAVKKWRTGGFHLVLMDIQLPVMNGLDATREIRRLERVNSIGVFSSSPGSLPERDSGTENGEVSDQDRLENISLFKSPVIIVALTASSLQSDRHEALAAGCNDFLTKPVNFVWLERKVMEWGCMQALIDFDGWRQWKDFSQEEQEENDAKAAAAKNKLKKKSAVTAAA